jgi:epsilon-lactone hydrolase
VQRVQRGIARCEGVPSNSLEQMRAPLREIDDSRGNTLGVQTQPEHVDRRFEQMCRGSSDERRKRTVGRHETPVPIDDERRIRLVPTQHLLDRVAYGTHPGGVELTLPVGRRVARGQEQLVSLAERHVESLGQMEDHPRAWARAAGFDEAQVSRRDVRLQRKLELTEPTATAPLTEHHPDRRPADTDGHASIVGRPSNWAITSEVIDTAHPPLHSGEDLECNVLREGGFSQEDGTMPSKESGAVRDLYLSWTAARLKGEQHDDEAWGDLTAEPRGVDYIETDAGGVPAMWLVPKGCAEDRLLLCMHGGGFVGGSIYSHRKLFGHLAKAAGVRALVFDYRLTPEHTHPAQVDDAVAAYRWLLEQGIDAGHVAFTGDSSGGGLAITTQLRARELGLPLPAAAMPFSPWFDMELTGASYELNRNKDAFFYKEVVQGLVNMFLGEGGNLRDPLANPFHADLSGLPPIYIQVGGDETLLDDSRRFAELAGNAGVDVGVEIFPEQQHTFQMAAGRAPEADDAIRKLAEWVRPELGLSSGARAA